MRHLDLSRKYARVYTAADLPRGLAAFEQDGISFDAHGREIVPEGAAPAPARPPASQDTAPPALSPRHRARLVESLIRDADNLPLSVLRREAGIVLGASCPAKKPGIVAALEAQLVIHRARLPIGALRIHPETIDLDGVDPAERLVAEEFPDP